MTDLLLDPVARPTVLHLLNLDHVLKVFLVVGRLHLHLAGRHHLLLDHRIPVVDVLLGGIGTFPFIEPFFGCFSLSAADCFLFLNSNHRNLIRNTESGNNCDGCYLRVNMWPL